MNGGRPLERYLSGVLVLLLLWLAIGAWRLRRRSVTPGPAAAGAMHEMLNSDRRAAVEIILEERTGERDPEDRDGDLPELERGATERRAGRERDYN